jgi:glycosyltransferase involved in cell wall biosynthesis
MIDVFTLTRERLDITKHCFTTLQEKAGHEFRHWILDNGSQDGTVEWLKEYKNLYANVQDPIFMSTNVGIAKGINLIRERMQGLTDCKVVVKFDNDCEVVTDNILYHVGKLYNSKPEFSGEWVVSPRVEGIRNQPERSREAGWNGYRIGVTGIVGGLFKCKSYKVHMMYNNNERLPLAWGNDDVFARWFNHNGGTMGYLEDLVVNHYLTTDGQARKYPEYFVRKWEEEGDRKILPGD